MSFATLEGSRFIYSLLVVMTQPANFPSPPCSSQDILQKVSSRKIEKVRKTYSKWYLGTLGWLARQSSKDIQKDRIAHKDAPIEMRGVAVDRKQLPKGYQEPTCICEDWVWSGRQRRVTFVERMHIHD